MTRTKAEQAAVDRDGMNCRRCGKNLWEQQASKHHRKKRRFPDADRVQNIVIICGTGTTECHGWCHANPEAAHEAGWVCWGDEEPADRPCTTLTGRLLWFLADGRVLDDPLLDPEELASA